LRMTDDRSPVFEARLSNEQQRTSTFKAQRNEI
jgi:hypothetical protein